MMYLIMQMEPWAFVLYLVLGLVVGGVLGFIIARKLIKKELKKNPPINEKMIRAMYSQMGRKPSEAQIRAIMNSVNKNL